jgi:serine/threonine protein kinase
VRRRPTSQRLDVFAFGVTVYELCAFELPWPRGAGLAAMAHGSIEPADIRTYCPQIDKRLEHAISACIESEPDRRPASMEEFLKMIKGVETENAA